MTPLVEIYRRFPDRGAAIAHLERVRWPNGIHCPACGAATVARKAEKSQFHRLQCWSCKRSFSATVGTIFHNSHIDLQRWFLLISLMLNAKKGLSAMQAARDLEMRRPTVWSMMKRIRGALADDGPLLSDCVMTVTAATAVAVDGHVIVHRDTGAIYGAGTTEAAAWSDLRAYLDAAQVQILEESDADIDGLHCARLSSYRSYPATQALLDHVEAHGGDVAYAIVAGVATTTEEIA
jgi:transposase-like protein